MAIMTKRKPKPKPVPDPPSWADKLRSLRERWGAGGRPLSQEAAAERLGVTRRTLIYWESGTQEPAGAACVLIGLFLSLPPSAK